MTSFISKAVKETIAYGLKYGTRYSRKEIYKRLISPKIVLFEEIPKIEGNSKISNQAKIEKAKHLAVKIAKSFNEIQMIGVTGSVAAGYPKKDDDIDLMVITKKDSLWRCRLRLRIWVWANQIPHRKYNIEQKEDEFCFNLWMEEDNLEIPKNKQNLKNAMDLILMKPVMNKNQTYEKFIQENNWAKKYVANGYQQLAGKDKYSKRVVENSNLIKRFINLVLFKVQYWYMKKKIKKELVNIKTAFFHPKNK